MKLLGCVMHEIRNNLIVTKPRFINRVGKVDRRTRRYDNE